MARQFKKLAHSLYECKYHVVFCPKYRINLVLFVSQVMLLVESSSITYSG